jgi:hypothetical protein
MSNILGWHTCNHEMARETLLDDSTRSNMPCRVSRCVIASATELKERFPEVATHGVFSWCMVRTRGLLYGDMLAYCIIRLLTHSMFIQCYSYANGELLGYDVVTIDG